MAHILVVEDDDNSAQMLAALIESEGHSSAVAATLAQARQLLAMSKPQVILLDLELPDGSGLDLFADAKLRGDAELVLVTGHATVESSVQALRLGAADYLTKPINVAQLRRVLARVASPSSHKGDLTELTRDAEQSGRFGRLWGRSAPMRHVYDQIGRVAPTAVSVLIVGESGTGKELVAQTVHDLSRRQKKTFLAVNCGAISPQLIESELFGHEKGSFTGAMRQHRGFFERADGGTLFLDEITEMPTDLQVKLLRVLETGTFSRVGSDEVLQSDVRIVAATNRNPQVAVAQSKLREDLYYRLNVFQIALPALRDRLDDIPSIATHFLDQLSQADGIKRVFSDGALTQLSTYHWPGNVRELRNMVQRAAIMADGPIINDVPLPDRAVPLERPTLENRVKELGVRGPSVLTLPIGTSMAQAERLLILATLHHCGGLREKTAELLGISLKTLYNRLRIYEGDDVDVDPPVAVDTTGKPGPSAA